MSEWQESTLKDLIEFIVDNRGKTPSLSDIGIELLEVNSVCAGRKTPDYSKVRKFVSIETYDSWFRKGHPLPNDILIPTVGTIGNVAFIKEARGAIAQNLIALRLKKSICSEYVYYFFSSSLGHDLLLSLDIGGVQPSIKVPHLLDLALPIPPLSEQRAIAAVLSSLDDKIDLLHRQNKTLGAMAETLFRQWFVEEAEEDWESGALGDVAVNIRDTVKTDNIQAETRYIGLEHIDRRNIALQQYGFGDDVSSNKYAFKKHDILFGKLRPYFHKVCFSPFSGICSTDILVIRPKQPEYLSFCLFAFFQEDVVNYATIGSGGTRMPRTDWETLKKYPIMIPDKIKLNQFNELTLPSIEKITRNLDQILTLEKMRDSLLPKLMSGEVRVKLEDAA